MGHWRLVAGSGLLMALALSWPVSATAQDRAEQPPNLELDRSRFEFSLGASFGSPGGYVRVGHNGEPGSRVRVEAAEDGDSLVLRTTGADEAEIPAHPTVLLVDDNTDLLRFLERLMKEAGWTLLTAESASAARKLLNSEKPNAALLDYMLPDGNGVELGVQLRQNAPRMQVIVMTGSVLPPEEEAICEEHDFPVLRKPFLASDVMNQIRSRLTPAAGATAR